MKKIFLTIMFFFTCLLCLASNLDYLRSIKGVKVGTGIVYQPQDYIEKELVFDDLFIEASEIIVQDTLALEASKESLKDPRFLGGGINRFRSWISKNIKYPAEAEDISGRVIATIIVGRDGYIRDVKIEDSSNILLSQAVIDVLNKSPRWTPAEKSGGVPVSIRIHIPINFAQMKKPKRISPESSLNNSRMRNMYHR